MPKRTPTKIIVPEKFLFQVSDWAVYQLFTSKAITWEALKLIKTDEEGKPLRSSKDEMRALRVSWGIDAVRFARSPDYVRFEKENPEAKAKLERLCAKHFTAEQLEAACGKAVVDEERRRLLANRASAAKERREKGKKPWFGDAEAEARFAATVEAAHAAALEEDAAWEALYR